MSGDTLSAFRAALAARGIITDGIVADGHLHRADAEGLNGKGDAAYVLHLDGVAAGGFQNWRDGLGWETWRAEREQPLTVEQRAQLKRATQRMRIEREAEQERRYAEAAGRARDIWAQAEPAQAHPYLKRKKVQAHGARLYRGDLIINEMACDGALLVPLRNAEGSLWSLEFIAASGEKRFLPMGRKRGCYFSMGKPNGSALIVAEGLATAASIHEASALAVAVAFDAGNLLPVATALLQKFPGLKLIIAADNDLGGGPNTGLEAAQEAARAVNGRVAVPQLDGAKCDFNDLLLAHGPEAVCAALEAAREPEPNEAPHVPERAESRLVAVSVGDFLAMEIPPRAYLLSPVLPEQGLMMIHGPRGLGKTHLSVGIAVAVASGGSFLRWQSPAPAGVLLIDGEMPAAALQERLARAIKASPRDDIAPGVLRIVTPDLNRESGMPDLTTVEGQQAVDALIGDAKLIVLDNLSSLMRSGIENDAESWLPLQTWALRHRAEGRSVLFIHHSGKAGAQRGTSRREDVLDTVIGLRRPGDYCQVQGARFEVHVEKGRSLYGEDAAPFEAHLTADAHGIPTWTLKPLENGQDERIAELAALGMKPGEIASDLGLGRATVYRHLGKLKTGGNA